MPAEPATPIPAVSVLMVVRRPEPRLFAEAVDSVLAQSFGALELVVVETPSEVAVAPLLAGHGDARVRHVAVPAGTPLPVARNVALEHARAPLVAVLDADDVAEPTRLAAQVAFLGARPDVAVVGSALRVVDAGGRELGVRRYPLDDAAIRTAMRRYNAIAQPAVLARRDALVGSGGYDPVQRGGCEDYELWCRMLAAGHRFANLPEPLVRYRIHGGSLKASHLRQGLLDTIAIKRAAFGGRLGVGDRLRILGERALGWLPPRVVRWLFLRAVLTRRPA